MKFQKIDVQTLLIEIAELPIEWMDDAARDLIQGISETVPKLREVDGPLDASNLSRLLRNDPRILDVLRLFFGKGQEPVAHMICDELGGPRIGWSRLRTLATQDPERIARALIALGIAVPFERGVTFTGRRGETAKSDFVIPSRDHPKIIIEAKGFEATGSKLTDFLGDVLKIGQAKEFHTYFFVVTDGRGWHNRQSDLRKLVEYHHEGLIDMIYTRARFPQLASDVKNISANE